MRIACTKAQVDELFPDLRHGVPEVAVMFVTHRRSGEIERVGLLSSQLARLQDPSLTLDFVVKYHITCIHPDQRHARIGLRG